MGLSTKDSRPGFESFLLSLEVGCCISAGVEVVSRGNWTVCREQQGSVRGFRALSLQSVYFHLGPLRFLGGGIHAKPH